MLPRKLVVIGKKMGVIFTPKMALKNPGRGHSEISESQGASLTDIQGTS